MYVGKLKWLQKRLLEVICELSKAVESKIVIKKNFSLPTTKEILENGIESSVIYGWIRIKYPRRNLLKIVWNVYRELQNIWY